MSEMISKELLSEVLGVNIIDIGRTTRNNQMIWSRKTDDGYSRTNSINIHELAHKCKEWIYQTLIVVTSYKYISNNIKYNHTVNVNSGKSLYQGNKYNRMLGKEELNLEYYCEITVFDGSGQTMFFQANTEPEAIFKACQWILDNKDKR